MMSNGYICSIYVTMFGFINLSDHMTKINTVNACQ